MAARISASLHPDSGGWLAALDGRVRLLVAAAFSLVVILLAHPAALLLAVALAGGLCALARLPLRRLGAVVAVFEGFMVMTLVLLPFTMPGEIVARVGPLTISAEGLSRALVILLRANAVVLISLSLLATMNVEQLGVALQQLRVPNALVQLLVFSIRYLRVLEQEYLRLRDAMRARGFRARTDGHTLRSYGYLVGMLLVRALDRSERVAGAMRCRGYDGRLRLLARSHLHRADWFFALALGGVLFLLLWVDQL